MHPSSGLQLLFALLLLLNRSSSSVHNDATESDPIQPVPVQETQEEPVEEDSNQARSGGRRPAEAARNGESSYSYTNSYSYSYSSMVLTFLLVWFSQTE